MTQITEGGERNKTPPLSGAFFKDIPPVQAISRKISFTMIRAFSNVRDVDMFGGCVLITGAYSDNRNFNALVVVNGCIGKAG